MSEPAIDTPPLGQLSKRIARRLLTSGGNRIELFMVEVQEEREHLLHLLFHGVMAAMLGMLALVTLSGVVAVTFWNYGPVWVLSGLTVLYAMGGAFCYWRLLSLQTNWKSFSASLDQLEKDRIGLERSLS